MGKNRRFLLPVSRFKSYKRSHSGDDSTEDPPVPIPNTEVKLCHARSSWVLTLQDTVVAGFQKKTSTLRASFFIPLFVGLNLMLPANDRAYALLRRGRYSQNSALCVIGSEWQRRIWEKRQTAVDRKNYHNLQKEKEFFVFLLSRVKKLFIISI